MIHTYKGFILTDKDKQLVVRGIHNRKVSLVKENGRMLPVLFPFRAAATRCIVCNPDMEFTKAANAYCKLYRVPTEDLTRLLHPEPCVITIEF